MRERFAPSPTGLLHLGHAFSALTAWNAAKVSNAEFLLRIEDIDVHRSRPEFESAIYDDLHWLGIEWKEAPVRQSQRSSLYDSHLNMLINKHLCYPCSCTRHDIHQALLAPQETHREPARPHEPTYPGTCRMRSIATRSAMDAVRINIKAAIDALGGAGAVSKLGFWEIGSGTSEWVALSAGNLIEHFGDVVLARKDIGTSYHLAVTVDDFDQEISHITRGEDMRSATAIHVLLQSLLGFKTPIYRHHKLIRDQNGKRLAKRDNARALATLRAQGHTPTSIRKLVGL